MNCRLGLAASAAAFLFAAPAIAAVTLSFSGSSDAAFEGSGGYLDVVRGLPASTGGSHLVPIERSVGQLRQGATGRRGHHLPTPATGLPVADGGTGVDQALTNVPPFVGTSADFGNGEALAFTLTRVGNIVTFTFGTAVLASDSRASLADITAIEFRIRTASGSANSIVFSDLLFSDSVSAGQVIPGFAAADGDLLILLYEGIAPGDFTLSGTITQNWTAGARPGGSALATQIKLLDLPAMGIIPEPATWAMLIAGFGLVGAGMRRRRAALA